MRKTIFMSALALVAVANLFAVSAVAAESTAYEPELVFELQSDMSYEVPGNAINAMAAFGENLAFTTDDGTMYVTDGTTSGTSDLSSALAAVNVMDVIIDREVPYDESLDLDGTLLFWGLSATSSTWELFTTDGVTVTQLTTTINGTGTLKLIEGQLYVLNDNVDEMQHVDVDTGVVTTIQDHYDCSIYSETQSITGLNGKIIFHYDLNSCDDSLAVWNPATPLVDPVVLAPEVNGLGGSSTDTDYLDDQHYYFVFDGYLYFAADSNIADSTAGVELMRTDGTTTTLVKDIYTGSFSSLSEDRNLMFTEFDGDLYFTANAGSAYRLWKTDGTSGGTVEVPLKASLVKPGDATNGPGIVVNGKMVTSFYTDESGDEMYATDGTDAGTELLIEANPGAESGICWDGCTPPVLFDSTAFFLAFDGEVNAIFASDGSAEGTVQVTDASDFAAEYAISDYSDDSPLVVAGDSLYFAVTDWLNDGGSGRSALYKFSPSTQTSVGLANTGFDAFGAFAAAIAIAAAGVTALMRRRRRSDKAEKPRPWRAEAFVHPPGLEPGTH